MPPRPPLRTFAVLLGCVSVLGCGPGIRLEAEKAETHGLRVATTLPGYSGRGYLTGFDEDGDRAIFRFKASAGVYDLRIIYRAAHLKRYDLSAGGVVRSDFLPPSPDRFAAHPAGKVWMEEGENVITLERGWGHYDIDRMELIPSSIAPTPPVSPALVTPGASAGAQSLMAALSADYGKRTWAGVYSTADAESVFRRTGVRPRVFGGDLMDYTPSRAARGARPIEPVETLLDRAAEGYAITLCWHWNAPAEIIGDDPSNVAAPNAPWHRGFMTDRTSFDIAAAMADPGSGEYAMLIRDIDAIAIQLRRFEAAGVPVLWRPLHEADGKWFWWGAKGPEAFKALWHMMFDRLVNHHGLRNLIWVYTGTADMAWYPPDGEFDLIGVDAYPDDPKDPQSAVWEAIQSRYAGRKMIALTEFGGVPDLAAMDAIGVRFAYFNSWTHDKGPDRMSDDALKALYAAPQLRGG